jgi:signal transduction histidine kinase
MRVLEKPDGFYFTRNYDELHNIDKESDMYGVKDYVAVAVWAGDKPIAVICADHLITKRPIADEQLEALRLFAGYAGMSIQNARLNEALQSELQQRQTFIDELETKNAELERFTYTVSHDLKSPLVTITGFLSYLERDALNGNTKGVKSGIERITKAARKMQALLNDLLELSRVGRIMNSPEDVPFDVIVNEAIEHLRGQLEKLDVTIETKTDYPIVRGDRVRLIEVVQNLIENALKYSKPKTKPRIEIGTIDNTEAGQPIFYVRDNGIGIEKQYHDQIFGLFNKLDAQSEGTGIGLSLVKRIIEVHDGRIWVESEKGRGSAFFFSLPTSKSKE